ncbi:MAG: hypothetical protein JO060_04300 [Candidatus Eremiobacteraeota bacterium]|nr:hypothetical protein [Candidatus Eremiobacteraeota bacterium]
MHGRVRQFLIVLLLGGSVAAANGCVHLKGGTSGPLPTGVTSPPSGVTQPPSGNCQSQSPNATVLVEISPDIRPTTYPLYGSVGEFATAPPSGNQLPGHAAPIQATSADVVQFANVDGALMDSAVGLGTGGFPSTPHGFPGGAQNPIGTLISSSTWSTGRLGIGTTNACFSQTFTLPQLGPGATLSVYFGDLDLYNSIPNGTAYRDVIVVSAAAARTARRHVPPLSLPQRP